MLAPRDLPPEYRQWNRTWQAPHGRWLRGQRYLQRVLPEDVLVRLRGPFCIQPNNDTRRYEYPWAYFALPRPHGLQVMDLGGGLSGFQFVLAREGLKVVNVDPGTAEKGWPVNQASIDRLNRIFGAAVQLKNCTLADAAIAPGTFDRVYCLSVLEHFSVAQFSSVVDSVWACLKPGGHFVVTADLFLDLEPFTSRKENEWGTNFPIARLLEHPGFECTYGSVDEIYGSATFDSDRIQSNLAAYLIGGFYPVLVQCLILRKRPD
ncbi:MAG: class I SAM-dependent methyltransferase [Bdellovibrionales bacterium]|nr:class I SAM-dependent methyltransferase [Bdellovibrionales bacterium]